MQNDPTHTLNDRTGDSCLRLASAPMANIFQLLSGAFQAECRPVPVEHLELLWSEVTETEFQRTPENLDTVMRQDAPAAARSICGFVSALQSIMYNSGCGNDMPLLRSVIDAMQDIASFVERAGQFPCPDAITAEEADTILYEAFSPSHDNRWLSLA